MEAASKANLTRRKLSQLLADALGQKASSELLSQCPDLLKQIQAGQEIPTIAELLVAKVVQLALDPAKQNQWAVEMIFDRVEGKPVAGIAPDDQGRPIEDRLDDITGQYINELADRFVRAKRSEEAAETRDRDQRPAPVAEPPSGRPSPLLDLPQNRARRPQDVPREPPVESPAEKEGDV
ncbi:MAG: hypothetical protein IT443_11835 [Phycisphaeraceae bacterium]|nr:hypothetical protein [Phycisphaeraceae bacterium]